jgi:FTR1 family protein
MLQSFIVTLREGVEAALIIGITLAYLNKIGRAELKKLVYWGLAGALLASVFLAWLLPLLEINEEAFEGWVMLAAAFFVVTMLIFMMRTARYLKAEIETRVGSLAGRGSRIGLFLFVFLMVLREGVETVLILSAISMNSSELLSFMGTLLGVAASVVFGVMFVKGSMRINLQKFFKVTTVILAFVAFQLVVSGLHELSELGVVPANKQSMAVIGPIVRNDVFFFITIVALAALMVLFETRRRQPSAVPASGAERRKAEWSARRERAWMAAVYASSFIFIVLVTAQFIYAKSKTALSPAQPVSFADGRVVIPITDIGDGKLHRYVADVNGTPVRFLLYRKPEGKAVAVFDACEICGPVGFYDSPEGIVCKNCDAPITAMSMGQPGGCNPIPLKAEVEGDNVVVTQTALSEKAAFFQ